MFDVCVVGSGAGAGPIIYELSKAGYKVVVLEKGPWIKTEHWSKDEMAVVKRRLYQPDVRDEKHVTVKRDTNGRWRGKASDKGGTNFWNGSCVGGSSNFMSAYFHRLKPKDFRLLSEYGPIKGANVVDWPISYDDMEPYYTKVEEVVGVSGKVVPHKHLEPRSTPDFPYPPLNTNVIADWYVEAGKKLGYNIVPAARGIISQPKGNRKACYHSNYCGSFGCSSDAKGSSRAALIDEAVTTGNCEVRPESKVFRLDTDETNEVKKAWYYDANEEKQSVEAKIFVVACRAIETARLLLMSKNEKFPNGLGNNSGQVGKNMIFAGGGAGSGYFNLDKMDPEKRKKFDVPLTFVNQALNDFYEIENEELGGRVKGGVIDFLIEHSAPSPKASRAKKDGSKLLYGSALKESLVDYFIKNKRVRYEVFCDWLPTDKCFVSLDDEETDKWGDPVARVQIFSHKHDNDVGHFLADRAMEVMEEIGAERVSKSISGNPPSNLVAGGCRFGNDPKKSVLDKNCKSHEVDNLYVTDGSFMPTGGSVPHTFTIYANSFRVADQLLKRLKK